MNKKLNRKEVLNNHLKSENKDLRYKLVQNFQEQATRLQKSIVDNGTLKKASLLQSRNQKVGKFLKQKKIQSDPSLLLKLEDLKEQVKFFENEKLLLKVQLDNFQSNKKGQYSNSTRVMHTKI